MQHVVATAGHVDHGKSTLVHALTGMEPDRFEEERRRGLTLDLGFAWTTLPGGREIAFVDVPGHERFTANMLAGVGPVPAALFVVAADEGWAPQSGEHLAALAALQVRHAVLAVTKADLADPAPVLADARRRLLAAGLTDIEAVSVSGRTGAGLDGLRAALGRILDRLPPPDPLADVRLWVDRAFTIRGSGSVVTGTLGAGRLAVDVELEVLPGAQRVRVRGLQSLERTVTSLEAVARAAVNLRGVDRDTLGRGQALCTPGAFVLRDVVDVRLTEPAHADGAGDEGPAAASNLGGALMLHVGSAAVPVRARALGRDTARIRLDGLPLRFGDRGILRDPAARRVLAGIVVLDPDPPALRGRGAARARAAALVEAPTSPEVVAEVRRRGPLQRAALRSLGILPPGSPLPEGLEELGGRVVATDLGNAWREGLAKAVGAHVRSAPLAGGLPRGEALHLLGVPDATMLQALVAAEPSIVDDAGRLRPAQTTPQLPPEAARALENLRSALVDAPFRAPPAADLPSLGLTPAVLALLGRSGAVLRLYGDVVLLGDAEEAAAGVLATVASPFTLAEARTALGTTRRTAVPLMEHLDTRGRTRRIDDTHRILVTRRADGAA